MKYTVLVEPSDEGFAVSVPGLPGCHSQGDTEAEALANIAKHSQARMAAISVTRVNGALVVEVTDDGRGLDAQKIRSKAIELDPKFALAWYNRGVAYDQLDQFDKAIADFSKAIELDSKYALAWYNRGMAYLDLGQKENAIADYSKAIELDSKLPAAHNNLAWLLATCPDVEYHDPGRAVELAKKAVALEPKNGNYWNTLGTAYYRAGKWPAAIEALSKSMELRNGGDSFDWFFLAMAHRKEGHKDEARKWYDRAAKWLETNQLKNEELIRFRAEAAALLGI